MHCTTYHSRVIECCSVLLTWPALWCCACGQESLSSETTLRRQSGKQFLTLIEQLRERVGEVAEASARDLTEAVGQLNLRISRIYDDVDNLVKVSLSITAWSHRSADAHLLTIMWAIHFVLCRRSAWCGSRACSSWRRT